METAFRFIQGGGEMGELTRRHNWANTSIGTPDQWPQSLLVTLGILLHSSFPMFLFWGPDHLCFYNDAFRPSLGTEGKHPAIGKRGADVWTESWGFSGKLVEQVMATGESVWYEDQLSPSYRNGSIEDIYWTFSYSPAYNDEGKIHGVFVTCTETTKNVNALKALSESEKRFQTLIKDATVGIVVLMGDDKVVAIANDAYGKIISYDATQLPGRKLFDVVHEAEPYFENIIDNVRNTGTPYFLYDSPYVLTVEGEQVSGYLNLIYQPYKTETGEVTGVMVLCHDVTEQVHARKRIEESEQRVRSIVESAPFPIGVYVGREMRIELANQSILDAWGKGSDVVGKQYSEILPELDNQAIFGQLDSVYATGIPFHARNQRVDIVVDNKLQPYYFNYSFTPLFDTEGNVYGVMNTAAETTDLNLAKQKVEQSEKNFRNMILQAPVAMCILLGPEHVVEIANDLMIALWGKPKADVMGRPIFEGLPDAREQGLEGLLAHVYNTGETFTASERPVELLRDGHLETIYQNFVYEPYRDSDGNIVGVTAITIDVTPQVMARLKIEEVVTQRTLALADANNNLERSNSALAQFAYIASHDLQEPVRKVSTFTQMLESSLTNIDDSAQNYINKIKNSSARMHVLIKDVLAYSELTRINQAYTQVDLQKVVEEIKTDFELLVEQKQAQIVAEGLPQIDANPVHMSQLFGNLISNALKFSKADTYAVINITASRLDASELAAYPTLNKDNTYCKIKVADNGIGFSQEYASQIFNIFQRLHGKKDYEGTGIGLAMCQKIVQNHNGEIYAESTPGVGSTFVIILPVRQVV